jgi:hypothetical protein
MSGTPYREIILISRALYFKKLFDLVACLVQIYEPGGRGG